MQSLQLNIQEAKTHLSEHLSRLEKGELDQIILARYGRPVAQIILCNSEAAVKPRLGVAKGCFVAPGAEDAGLDEAVSALFTRMEG